MYTNLYSTTTIINII